MEKINRNNYELYFVDYLDGNLDSWQKDDLMAFLRNNPDLKRELDLLRNIPVVEKHTDSFKDKDALKKQLTLSRPDYTLFDELSIGKLEGALTESQNREFNQLINEFPDKKKEYERYKKTVLKPDKNLQYEGKSDLKRGRTIILYRKTVSRYMAFAASILLMVGLYFLTPEVQEISYNDDIGEASKIVENKIYKDNLLPSSESVEKGIENINYSSTAYNEISNQPMNEGSIALPEPENRRVKEEMPERIQTKYSIRISREPVYAYLVEPDDIPGRFQIDEKPSNNYGKVQRFLATSIEAPVKEKLAVRNFSLWEIADLGFEGISKLTGKEIFLKRHYDEEGNLESLAFQTESFSFSTDLKK